MSRILFEPKRSLLLRLTMGFALVLAIQGGLSGYLILNAMDKTLQHRLDSKLSHVGSVASANSFLRPTLLVQADDPQANAVIAHMNNALRQITLVADVQRAYLFRVEGKLFTYLSGTIPPGKPLPKPQLTNTQMQLLSAGQSITTEPYLLDNGQLVKTAYVPILQNERLRGLLAIDDSATDLAVMTQLQKQLYLITALGFAVVVLVALMIANTIIKPVGNLVSAAEKLGLGNFDARFKVTGHDEINFLGQTFNDMAEDIQARDDQIRRMSEAALADAQQLYEHVLRAMVSTIITADMKGNLTSENPAAGKLLGEKSESVKTIEERLAEHEELLAFWRERNPVSNQEITLESNGQERFVEATLQPVADHRNQQIGYSLSLVDRTEEKRLGRELSMRERLAALGELAAGIAHEVRNPLNGIELMLGLVQEDLAERGVIDERFIKIHDEVARLNVILTDFLLFARPKPLEKEAGNLVDLIEDALILVVPDIEHKQITVVRDYDDNVPKTMIDPAAIRRAMVNLIKNACQAMDQNGTLTLSIKNPGATQDGFSIEVRDTGPGIPADVKERLFHPFVTTKNEGTGLGLSIVHKTIVNHHGSIDCCNHASGGACFVVHLPFVEVS